MMLPLQRYRLRPPACPDSPLSAAVVLASDWLLCTWLQWSRSLTATTSSLDQCCSFHHSCLATVQDAAVVSHLGKPKGRGNKAVPVPSPSPLLVPTHRKCCPGCCNPPSRLCRLLQWCHSLVSPRVEAMQLCLEPLPCTSQAESGLPAVRRLPTSPLCRLQQLCRSLVSLRAGATRPCQYLVLWRCWQGNTCQMRQFCAQSQQRRCVP
jgi:hypothetical protein